MAPRFLTILTGRLPKIRQSREPEPSIINGKTIADFGRVVEQMSSALPSTADLYQGDGYVSCVSAASQPTPFGSTNPA
jgi:hypothetical protein